MLERGVAQVTDEPDEVRRLGGALADRLDGSRRATCHHRVKLPVRGGAQEAEAIRPAPGERRRGALVGAEFKTVCRQSIAQVSESCGRKVAGEPQGQVIDVGPQVEEGGVDGRVAGYPGPEGVEG